MPFTQAGADLYCAQAKGVSIQVVDSTGVIRNATVKQFVYKIGVGEDGSIFDKTDPKLIQELARQVPTFSSVSDADTQSFFTGVIQYTDVADHTVREVGVYALIWDETNTPWEVLIFRDVPTTPYSYLAQSTIQVMIRVPMDTA